VGLPHLMRGWQSDALISPAQEASASASDFRVDFAARLVDMWRLLSYCVLKTSAKPLNLLLSNNLHQHFHLRFPPGNVMM